MRAAFVGGQPWTKVLETTPMRIPLTPWPRSPFSWGGAGTPHPVARVLAAFYLATTVLGAENSEVLRPASVAVAVILCPAGTAWEGAKAKAARPSALVVTAF